MIILERLPIFDISKLEELKIIVFRMKTDKWVMNKVALPLYQDFNTLIFFITFSTID